MALYSGVRPPHSLEVTCAPQPSSQSKEHSSAFNKLHRIAASQIIDLQLTDTQSLSRAQYVWKSVWTLQHPSVPPGTLSAVLELGHIIREWKDHMLALVGLLLLNRTLAFSHFPVLRDLRKSPMKPNIVFALMIGLKALSTMRAYRRTLSLLLSLSLCSDYQNKQ